MQCDTQQHCFTLPLRFYNFSDGITYTALPFFQINRTRHSKIRHENINLFKYLLGFSRRPRSVPREKTDPKLIPNAITNTKKTEKLMFKT